MSTLASQAEEDACFWLLVSDPAAANQRAAARLLPAGVQRPSSALCSGPAKELTQCRDNKTSLSFLSLLLAPTACASQGLILCLWLWLRLEQLSWELGQVLLGLRCGASSLSAWLHCLSCCQLSGPMPAEGTGHLRSRGHIPPGCLATFLQRGGLP